MEYICVTRCFYQNQRYKPGDPLNIPGRKKPPGHFRPRKAAEKILAHESPDLFGVLPLGQQEKIRELAKKAGLDLEKELAKRNVKRLAMFPPDLAFRFIEELKLMKAGTETVVTRIDPTKREAG